MSWVNEGITKGCDMGGVMVQIFRVTIAGWYN